MPIASVDLTLVDGALGVSAGGIAGHIAAVYGPSTTGDLNTPAAYARPEDVQTDYGVGPLVSLASELIYRTGKPCIVVRSDQTTDGGYGAVDNTHITGACAVTADAAVKPYDEYEAKVLVVTGGTVGVAGITYKESLDNGRTYGALKSLGTATSITIAAGNVKFSLTSATLVAGDYWTCRTTPPLESAQDAADARTAIAASALPWDFVAPANVVSGTEAGAIDTWLGTLWAAGKHKGARVSARGPAENESEATWAAAVTADFAAVASQRMAVGTGYVEFQAAIPGKPQLRRPEIWITTARSLRKDFKPWKQDIGQVDLGNLGSDVKIRDTAGNPKTGLHDESINPGLDTAGFETLTTLEGFGGAYCTTPNVKCALGSDYYLWQYIALINRAADAAFTRLMLRCRKFLFLAPATGYLTDVEAKDIDNDVVDAVRSVVGDSVSAITFAIDRSQKLLPPGTRPRGALRIVPLAYPPGFDVSIGFTGPANG